MSNIGDRGYLGPNVTLSTFGPMLKRKSENPHATLITLFLNAVMEETNLGEHLHLQMANEMKKAKRYLPATPPPTSESCPEFVRFIEACMYFRDFDIPFGRFVRSCRLDEIAKAAGIEMKPKNTIIDKWPMRLRSNATQEEFDLILGSGHVGFERYIEWKSLV